MERLALGRRAVEVATTGLPDGLAETAAGAAHGLIDAVFPDPSAVDPRTHFTTWLGVTSSVERPGGLLAVKLYANLDAPGGDGVTGLVARWPVFGRPASIALTDCLAEPRFAAVGVTATGAISHRVYVRPRASRGHELLTRVSALCSVDANSVLAEVHGTGLSQALWTGDMVVKVEAPEAPSPGTAGSGEPGGSRLDTGVSEAGGRRDLGGRVPADPSFAVHLAGTLAGAPERAWALVPPALERVVGSPTGTRELLEVATGGSQQSWLVSGIGLGFRRDLGHHATNVYLVPAGAT
jgi:hypothetical protein